MLKQVRPAFVLLVAMTLLTGLVYPLAITGLAELLFPHQAQGSLIEQDGHVVGSALIGQQFASDRYFHGRPSATLGADPAERAASGPLRASSCIGIGEPPSLEDDPILKKGT